MINSVETWVCTCPGPDDRPWYCVGNPPPCDCCVYFMDPDDLPEVLE